MPKDQETQDDQRTGKDDKGKGQGAGGQGVEIDGKVYSVDDVKQLLGQVSAATQSNQMAARLKNVAEKYGIDPESYLVQAEGALAVVSELIDRGIIDEKGEIVQQKGSGDKGTGGKKSTGDSDLDDLFGLDNAGGDKGKGASSVEEIVKRALAPALEEVSSKVNQLAEIQAGMIREEYGRKIKSQFENLDDEDVARVFASYQRDKSVPLMEHAKRLSEKKQEFLSSYEKQLAEKWGVDLEKVKGRTDENKTKDAPGEGGAGVLFQGKKFSFRKSGEGYISPKEAAQEYFKKVLAEEG